MNLKKDRIAGVFTAVLVWVLMGALHAPAEAQHDGLRFGKFDIDAGLTMKGEYNDNVFYDHEDEKDDFIFIVTPAIGVDYTMSPGNYLNMGYAVDLAAYIDYTDNNYDRHNPFVNLELSSPTGVYLKLTDSLVHTDDPYGSLNEYRLGRSTERWNNTLYAAAGYTFAQKYGIELSYDGFVQRYDETIDEWQDVDDNAYGVALYYQFSPKTRVFGQYQYREVEYPEQNDGASLIFGPDYNSQNSQDNTQNLFFVGADFRPLAKIKGQVKLGYGRIAYDNRLDRFDNPYEDEDTWVAETRIGYQMRERTRIDFVLNRSFKSSSDEVDEAPGYFDTLVSAGVVQDMKHRLQGSLSLDWNILDYQEGPGPEKYFDIYRANVGLKYIINEFLDTGILYQFRDKVASRSAYEDDEYTINSIALVFSAEY